MSSELLKSEQEDLELFATELGFSEAGVLKNAYLIAPHEDYAELLCRISSTIEKETGTPATIIHTDYPEGYDKSHHHAQSLLVAHQEKIVAAPTQIIILLFSGFERFYGPLPERANQSNKTSFKDPRQHIWDQCMIECSYFEPTYQSMLRLLQKANKKVFCLFQVEASLGSEIKSLAEHSISYSHFSARRKPLISRPLQNTPLR